MRGGGGFLLELEQCGVVLRQSMRSEDYAASYNPLQVGRQRMIGALKDRSQSNAAKAAVSMSAFRVRDAS